MSAIVKIVRNIYRDLNFKFNSVYRGEGYTAFQSLIVYNKQPKEKEKITLKYHQYPELNSYFLQFMNSAETGGRVNGDNLAFLIGSENIGKTSYVQSNIERFKMIKNELKDQSKKVIAPILHIYKSPEYVQNEIKEKIFQNEHFIVLNFNFKSKPCLNYSSFLRQIHESIISQIIKLNMKLDNRLLNKQIIKQILIAQNSQEYLYVYVKDVIYCIINDCDIILLSESAKKKLEQLNQQLIEGSVQSRSFFSQEELYPRLINILMQDLKISEAQAAIRLFFSVAKRIQYQNRPKQHLHSWYESGIQSTNYLFDILNYLNGFGKLHRQIFDQYYQGKQPLSPFKESLIKNFLRIDIGAFFLNMDNLYFYGSIQYWNFVDHIISRTANMSGLRTHFPIMIQFSNFAEFQEVHDMGQFNYGTPVVIEIPGYKLVEFLISVSNISTIFTPKILASLFYRLGRNPSTWNKAIIQMAKGKTSMKDVITGKSQYLVKQSIRVQARINAIFTHNDIIPQLNDRSARFQLVQHLRILKKGKGVIVLDRPGYYIDFYTRPIWRLLMRQKLVYMHYYLPYVDVSNLTDLTRLTQIKNSILKGNFLNFLSWRWKNKGVLTIYGRQIGLRKALEKDSHHFDLVHKVRKQGQLRQTYYGANHNYIFHYKQKGVHDSIN